MEEIGRTKGNTFVILPRIMDPCLTLVVLGYVTLNFRFVKEELIAFIVR